MATRCAVLSLRNQGKLFSRQFIFTATATRRVVRPFSTDSDRSKGFWDAIMGDESRLSGAHSKLLSGETKTLYEFQFHHLRPDRVSDYTDLVSSELPRISDDPEFPATLLGSWTTLYGPLDTAIHLWVYNAGYDDVTKAKRYLHINDEFLAFAKERAPMIRNRRNELVHGFSFWGEPRLRDTKNIYELRTYYLKPGTLIEWSNNWKTALKYRQKINEDVGGFFTQIGELYVVHHLWAYSNLSVRKISREAAWDNTNWADCVSNTVPIIRKMDSRILLPSHFSPLT